MPRVTTIIAPAGLLGLLLLTTPLQAEPAAQSATAMAKEAAGQLSAGSSQEATPRSDGSNTTREAAPRNDAAARAKAREIILQMEKKLDSR